MFWDKDSHLIIYAVSFAEKACTAQLSEQENADIESNVNKVPCLIVLGQTCAAKVHVVNQIFQKTVLPLPQGEEPRWRTVCFRYGSTPSLCLSLPGSFELVNDLMIKNDAWKTISAQNLELRESEVPDLADGIATLEVKIRHSLLKDGGMVAVASSSGATDGPGAWESFGRISENRVPVVIYAIARDSLSEQVSEFMEFAYGWVFSGRNVFLLEEMCLFWMKWVSSEEMCFFWKKCVSSGRNMFLLE